MENLETEDYVQFVSSMQSRSYIAQVRLRILSLKVETREFTNTPVEEQIYELCALGLIKNLLST